MRGLPFRISYRPPPGTANHTYREFDGAEVSAMSLALALVRRSNGVRKLKGRGRELPAGYVDAYYELPWSRRHGRPCASWLIEVVRKKG